MAQYWLDIPADPRTDAEILALFELVNTVSGATHSLTVGTESGVRALRLGRATNTSVAVASFLPVGSAADVDIVANMVVESVSTTAPGGISARAAAALGTAQWYCGYSTGSTSMLGAQTVPTAAPTSLASASSGVTQSSYHWRRFQVAGTTLQQKVWAGARGDEPGAWLHSITATTYSSGAVGIASRGGTTSQGIVYVQQLAIGTDGDPAPTGPAGGERQRSRLILTPW